VADAVLSFLTRCFVFKDSIMCIAVDVKASDASTGEWRIHVPGLLVDSVHAALLTRALEWWVRKELIEVPGDYSDLAPILNDVRDHESGDYDYKYWEGRMHTKDAKVVPLVSTSDTIYVHRMGTKGSGAEDLDLEAVLNRDERELLRYTTVRSDAMSTNFDPRECFPFSPPPIATWPKSYMETLEDSWQISMSKMLATRMKLGEKCPSHFVRKRCSLQFPTPLDFDVYPVGFYSNYCPLGNCVHEKNGCVRFQLRAFQTHGAKMCFKECGYQPNEDAALDWLGAKGCDAISVSVYCAECNQTSWAKDLIPGPPPTYKCSEELALLNHIMWDDAIKERPESVPLVTDVVVAERIASMVSKVSEDAVKNVINVLKRAHEKEQFEERKRRQRARV
jgi:hypothetical protein